MLRFILACALLVIAAMVLPPFLEPIFPNTVSQVPSAIQSDMDYISATIEVEAAKIQDKIQNAASGVMDGVF